jgi:hypothetical protein
VSRFVEVRPPSASGETGYVLRAAGLIVGAVLLVVTSHRLAAPRPVELFPFQRAFADLDGALQRDQRELREGLIEAMRARDATGSWPEPAALAAEGVPPFAGDGVEGRTRDWTLARAERIACYFGSPRDGASGPELLLQILEPAPGDPESADPRTPTDDVHQRLASGAMLHVFTWFRDPPRAANRALEPGVAPEKEGWIQVVREDPRSTGARR